MANDRIFIVMPFVEHDLKTLLADMPHPFVQSEVKTIMLQLLSAVEYCHANWIVSCKTSPPSDMICINRTPAITNSRHRVCRSLPSRPIEMRVPLPLPLSPRSRRHANSRSHQPMQALADVSCTGI